MVFFPNCKINIGLDILRKRPDGYHDIETVMYPVRGLCDILEIVPSGRDGVEFSSAGLSMDCRTADNLCYKAYQAVAARYNIGGVKMHLHKIIPFGAGLGGGSSDAVCTVNALSKIFELGIHREELKDIAAGLGSDTVFFADNTPALSSGRGEILEPVSIPELAGKTLLIVKPDFGVSTAAAYSSAAVMVPAMPLREKVKNPVRLWEKSVLNAFEVPVFSMYPELAGIKRSLYQAGAIYASMSGSGSAMYGIFETGRIDHTVKGLFPDCFVYHEVI